MRAGGRSLLRLDRGGGPASVGGRRRREAVGACGRDAVLVADYGRGVAALPAVRARARAAAPGVPVVWDPHPRGAGARAGRRAA